ncbi:hypothetical protein OAT71_00530 [Flavobacteriales bacterium]|jgi:hypothetical protein|nr:hypothetical protein [Flavobacteriales bacterium]
MKKKVHSQMYIGLLVVVLTGLIACTKPTDPVVVVNVKYTNGQSATGAIVTIFPNDSFLNPDIASPADTADTNFMNTLDLNQKLNLMLASDSNLIEKVTSDAQGKAEFTKAYPMILNISVVKDSLSGTGMANFVEDETTEVQITIN